MSDLMQLMADHRSEIAEMPFEDFLEKHPRYKLLQKKLEEIYRVYKSHPWLTYAAQPVIKPEFHELRDYITKVELRPQHYRMAPKTDYLPNDPNVWRVYFMVKKVPETNEIFKTHTVTVDVRSDLDIGVRPSNWTSLEFIPWYEGYGLLVLNTDVCAQGWLGYCTIE